MGEYAFDADSRVTAAEADGEFTAQVTGRWDGLGGAANGGYLLATCTRAMGMIVPFPDPVVVSGFFLRPGGPGPARIRTELIRSGRTTAFGQASLSQDGKEVIRATAAFTRFGQDGPVFIDGAPPTCRRRRSAPAPRSGPSAGPPSPSGSTSAPPSSPAGTPAALRPPGQ